MPETTVQNTLTRPMASDTHDAPHAPEAAAAPVPPDKVVVVLDAALPPGQAANVAACLSAGLAGAWPAWAGRPLNDAAGLASVAIAAEDGHGTKKSRRGRQTQSGVEVLPVEKNGSMRKEDRIAALTEEMKKAAKELRFEEAAYLRDRIRELEATK